MDSKEELREEKLRLLCGAYYEFLMVTFAVRKAQGHYGSFEEGDPNFVEELRKMAGNRTPTFSDYLNVMSGSVSALNVEPYSKGFYQELLESLKEKMPEKFVSREYLETIYVFLEKDSIIRDDFGFVVVFLTLLISGLLNFPEIEEHPKFDLVVMKTLFSAGKVIERWRQDGKTRSDKPSKAGRTKWKKKVSNQDVIEEFYRVDTNGKKPERICKEIREAFLKRGKNEDELYSTKTIRKILKDEWAKIQ